MGWKELERSRVYHIGLRLDGRNFTRSLNTEDEAHADSTVACVEDNLRLIERARQEIPKRADLMSFLLSNGKASFRIVVVAVTLRELFDTYFAALPSGNLKVITISTMAVHRRPREGYFGKSKLAESIDLVALPGYPSSRNAALHITSSRTISIDSLKTVPSHLRSTWSPFCANPAIKESQVPRRRKAGDPSVQLRFGRLQAQRVDHCCTNYSGVHK